MRKDVRGVTLIELVIVTVIVSALAGVFLHLVAAGFQAWFLVSERRVLVEQARVSMEQMVRNIQGDFARGNYHSAVSYPLIGDPVLEVNETEFTFATVSRDADASPGLWPWLYAGSMRYVIQNSNRDILFLWRTPSGWNTSNLAEDTLTDTLYSAFTYFGDFNPIDGNDNDPILPDNPGGNDGMSDSRVRAIKTVQIEIRQEWWSNLRFFTTRSRLFPRNEGKPEPYTGL